MRLIQLAIGFVILGAVLWPLERFFPSVPDKKLLRKGFRVDLVYWFFTPTVTAAFTFGVTVLTAAIIVVLSGGRIGWSNLAGGRPPISYLPVPLQYLAALLAADFLGYFVHRLFHRGDLWRFHAIHHSSEQLDWLSSARLHPVNQAIGQILIVAPLAILGFNLKTLGSMASVTTLWAIFVHSNVRWSFGPLRHIITTPAFHRWHHTSQQEGLDRNFGGLFLFWDRLFGTLHLPAKAQPREFGIFGDHVPDSFFHQLIWPFARK